MIHELFDCRDAFAATLEELAAEDERIVVLTNDSVGTSKLGRFRVRFPARFVNVGIAEQDLIGIAAGLSNGGLIPFACAASSFVSARAMEQIKVDLAYSEANVKVCGMSSGVAYGALGPTHHSIEDIAWLRAIPDLVVVVPADPLETTQAVRAAAEHHGPIFLRLSRMLVPPVNAAGYHFRIGTAARLREGDDLTIIANGTMVSVALRAANDLYIEGINARVLNMPTVKPLDEVAILQAAEQTGGIVSIEEATMCGALGGAVAEAVVQTHPVPMRILGFPSSFAPTGSAEFLLGHYGLTPEGVCQAAHALLGIDK